MSIRVLYFDLGNVLLSFSHEQMCRQLAEVAGVSPDLVCDALFGSELAHSVQWQFEMGQLDADGYFDYFCQQTGTRPNRDRLVQAACDIFQPIEPTAELVRRLAAAGNRLAIFSNINPPHWRFVTDGRFPVLGGIGLHGSHATPDPGDHRRGIIGSDTWPGQERRASGRFPRSHRFP